MIITTLSRTSTVSPLFNVQPQIYCAIPSTYTIADFWKTTFGVPDTSKTGTIDIDQIVINYLIQYNEVFSIADLRSQAQSFYWDMTNQILYINMLKTQSPLYDIVQQGRAYGFSDQELVYIDNIEYLPLVKSVSNIERSQDIKGYKKLAFLSGSVTLNNIGGQLDFLDTEIVNGNDSRIYYLNNNKGNAGYTQSDLVSIAGAYIEDYSLSLKECVLNLKDKRKSGDIKIPSEVFTKANYANIDNSYENKVIPLAYGEIRVSEAIPVDASTSNVIYRQAQYLTSLGTIELLIADVWTARSPVGGSTVLSTGTFTVATARDASGNPYKCRVKGSVGYTANNPIDVIVHLNDRYLDIKYTSSNYNTSECYNCTLGLSEIGVLFNKQIDLYEAIRILQDSSITGFRYDTDNLGLRTALLDDTSKDETFYIENVDIKDADDIGYDTDISLLASTVNVNYAKDYTEDKPLTVVNNDNLVYCTETYRIQPTQNYDTLNVTEADAITRAENEALKFKDARKIVGLTTMGDQFLPLRIYDTGTIELTNNFVDRDGLTSTGTRPWLGVWKVQILSVNPDISAKTNKIRALLVTKKY